MLPKVKICGITLVRDAIGAVEAGADALGFVFFKDSPRWIAREAAAEIIQELPPFVAKVGVFVNASDGMVRKTIEACGLDTLQFHGDETPEFCRRFGLKALKAFRVRGEEVLAEAASYDREAWLLDSFVAGKPGGTGAKFNWQIAGWAVKLGRPVILAGGLTPDNVVQAVRQVRPFGVDVSSGVELSPGRKDLQKVQEFIRQAKKPGRK